MILDLKQKKSPLKINSWKGNLPVWRNITVL